MVIDRPKTAPFGLLAICTSALFSQAIIIITSPISILRTKDFLTLSNVFVSLIVIGIILSMPLRDPALSDYGISPAFHNTTHELRSPEDNLTLWQFMSVTWMSPLLSLGSARQLHDDDVWSLSLEFQHRFLHDKFRELKGSVVKRLLTANGLDLVFVSILGILESLASRICH